jgi:hypothetical protein
MISQNFHVIVLYGYTEIGGEIFYNYFDPNGYVNFPSQEFGLRHQYTFNSLLSFGWATLLHKKKSRLAAL